MSHSETSETDVKMFSTLMQKDGLELEDDELQALLRGFPKMRPRPSGVRIEVVDSPSDKQRIAPRAPRSDAGASGAASGPSTTTTTTSTDNVPCASPRRRSSPVTSPKPRESEEERKHESSSESEVSEEETPHLTSPCASPRASPRPSPKQSPKQSAKPSPRPSPRPKPSPTADCFQEECLPSGEVDVDVENRNPVYRREKMELLFKLRREFGSKDPFGKDKDPWSMQWSLFELKYDYAKRQEAKAEEDNLVLMKAVLRVLFHALEEGNRRIGILQLEGWAKHSTSGDMAQYNRCLTGIYLRYFRKKQMNPILELLWLMVSSMLLWHFMSRQGPPQATGGSAPTAGFPRGASFEPNSGDLRWLFNAFTPFATPG